MRHAPITAFALAALLAKVKGDVPAVGSSDVFVLEVSLSSDTIVDAEDTVTEPLLRALVPVPGLDCEPALVVDVVPVSAAHSTASRKPPAVPV